MMNDSETVEDRDKGSVAEVTDDSCTVEFIEIVEIAWARLARIYSYHWSLVTVCYKKLTL